MHLKHIQTTEINCCIWTYPDKGGRVVDYIESMQPTTGSKTRYL